MKPFARTVEALLHTVDGEPQEAREFLDLEALHVMTEKYLPFRGRQGGQDFLAQFYRSVPFLGAWTQISGVGFEQQLLTPVTPEVINQQIVLDPVEPRTASGPAEVPLSQPAQTGFRGQILGVHVVESLRLEVSAGGRKNRQELLVIIGRTGQAVAVGLNF